MIRIRDQERVHGQPADGRTVMPAGRLTFVGTRWLWITKRWMRCGGATFAVPVASPQHNSTSRGAFPCQRGVYEDSHAIVALAAALCASSPASAAIQLVPVISTGIPNAVCVGHAETAPTASLIVDQSGLIRVLSAGQHDSDPSLLDIHTKVAFGGEQGLVGLAFHPQYLEQRPVLCLLHSSR